MDLELGFEAPHGEEEEDDDARRPFHCFDFCFDFFPRCLSPDCCGFVGAFVRVSCGCGRTSA